VQWEAHLKTIGISTDWASELMQLADGRKDPNERRIAWREAKRKQRLLLKSSSGHLPCPEENAPAKTGDSLAESLVKTALEPEAEDSNKTEPTVETDPEESAADMKAVRAKNKEAQARSRERASAQPMVPADIRRTTNVPAASGNDTDPAASAEARKAEYSKATAEPSDDVVQETVTLIQRMTIKQRRLFVAQTQEILPWRDLRRATPEETETAFAIANAMTNPIANSWDRASEEERLDFVRLYQAEISGLLRGLSHGQKEMEETEI
jgi:hypothetical protein